MLHLEQVGPRTPRLPRRRWAVLAQVTASAAVHVASVLSLVALIHTGAAPRITVRSETATTDRTPVDIRHIVFLAPDSPQMGGGGGGGGNRQPDPIRRAQGTGSDATTLRISKPRRAAAQIASVSLPLVEPVEPLASVVLDAKPLSSGRFDQVGLPNRGVPDGLSTGPGSGGGVGTGIGTGIGSGHGPGIGPGSGGGIGGGVYRPGGAVTVPRVITEVKPTYTSDALLHRIQGSVVLELVVTRDGCPSQIRVVRSLDPEGLDEQAVTAAGQWRFEPGRLGGTPVDVLVTIVLDFRIR